MTQPNSIFSPKSNPLEHRANWLGRYLSVERSFIDKLKKVLTEAASNIDENFGDLVNDNVSTKVARVRIALAHKEIRRQMRDIFGTTENLIRNHQQDAAVAAVNASLYDERGILSWLFPNSVDRLQYADSLRQTARRNIEATIVRTLFTEKPLSARVYKTQALADGLVGRTVNNALARGDSAKNLAKEVRALIDPNTPGGVSYAAMRLGRTEINNAFHAQSIMDSQEKPWVQEMRWYLSKRHEKDPGDECEIYAATGLFRKEEVPEKPHPNCRCYVTPELPDYDEFEKSLISGHYDPYLDSVMGEGFSQEIPSARFASETPARKAKPAKPTPVKWTGPKVGKPLQTEVPSGTKPGSKLYEEISDNNYVNEHLQYAWQSTQFDSYKKDFRLGGRDAMRVGYEKFPTQLKASIVEDVTQGRGDYLLATDPGVTRVYGKEIVARAVHSEPTTKPIWRGMIIERSKLVDSEVGKTIGLPLSSFDTDQSFAIDFAQGRAWQSEDVKKIKDPFPIIIQLEPGARVASLRGSERIAFGEFDVIDILPPEEVPIVRLAQDTTTERPTVLVVRQKSMIEPEVLKGRMTTNDEDPEDFYVYGSDDDDDGGDKISPKAKNAENLARIKKLLPNTRIELPEGINEDIFKSIIDEIEPVLEEDPELVDGIKVFGFREIIGNGVDKEGNAVHDLAEVKAIEDSFPERFKDVAGRGVSFHFDSKLASTKTGFKKAMDRSIRESTVLRNGQDIVMSPLQYPGVVKDYMKSLVRHEVVHAKQFMMGWMGNGSDAFSQLWRKELFNAYERDVDAENHPELKTNAAFRAWFSSLVSEMPRYAEVFNERPPKELLDIHPLEFWSVGYEQAQNRPESANKIDLIIYDIFNSVWDTLMKRPKKRLIKK